MTASTAAVVERKPPTEKDDHLRTLLDRIRQITGKPEAPPSGADGNVAAAASLPAGPALPGGFVPIEPDSFAAAGLSANAVEALVLKFLLATGDAIGREIADQIRLPFLLIDELLRGMKQDQLLAHKGAAPMNDFQYYLTENGRERARQQWARCTYFGSAPVSLKDYVASVEAQSLSRQQPTPERLRAAFADLSLSERMLDRLGPAVNSGRGMFLYGAAGNGKTSIAERVTRAFGAEIWIPRAIGIDGEIIRVYDPVSHEELPLEACSTLYDRRKVDKRWVRICRPTIIAGGELTMSSLEVTTNTATGISEAPLQVKSNCGTLVIDDFGRQRMKISELLNRWILPLERHRDFLYLSTGKKIEVPFEQLVIFSTNLEPRDLVDEAFLRRIPYKIEIVDPTEDQFRDLFEIMAKTYGFACDAPAVEHLIEVHYRRAKRPMRYCHPRDLLSQVRNFCVYKGLPLEVRPEYLDVAVENYFAVMHPRGV
ncbi:MAG: AAA family ATPase [Thermoguttaceae bacterium]